MAGRCFVGIDLGAESGRVMAGVFDGRRVRLDELHRFPNGPVELAGSLRWDVLAAVGRGPGRAGRGGRPVRPGRGVRRGRHLGRGLRPAVEVRRTARPAVPLPRRPDPRRDGAGLRDRAPGGGLRRHRRAVPPVQHALPAPRRAGADAGGTRRGGPAAADAGLPALVPVRLDRRRVHERDHDPALRPVSRRTWARDLLRRFDLPAHMLGEVVPPGTRARRRSGRS